MRCLAVLALVALVVGGCGKDNKTPDANPIDGKPIDAKPIDARTIDAPPDAQAFVLTVTCPGTVAATIRTDNLTNAYMPAQATINVNGIVRFEMSSTHNVRPITAMTDPGMDVPFGITRCLQFTRTGTFNFVCTPHGFTGTITVQ